MSAWTSDELNTIGRAEELELTRVKSDGTPRKPVTIWVVRNKVDLFIRSWRGDVAAGSATRRLAPRRTSRPAGSKEMSSWYLPIRALTTRSMLPIAPSTRPVAPSYVGPIVTPQARATTLKLERRS
jgi:hypothetical protein